MVQVALLQLNSGSDIHENLKTVEARVRDAAGRGAQFILTPENTCYMVTPQSEKVRTAPAEKDHPVLTSLSALARELGVWILIGSISVKVSDSKIANRSYLISDAGEIAGHYDKIHLFDVDLPTGESHRESDAVRPGEQAVVVETPFGKVGLSICYDLRFAYLYRALAKAGADIIVVPAAFTVPTGQAHWETLLRARAIETGSVILAPAQCGTHHGDRKTYGHSLAVGPWGDVLADGGEDCGIVMVNLDMDSVRRARNAIPSLTHDRDFIF